MRATGLMLLFSLSALACDATDDFDDGSGEAVEGKADDGARDSGTIFFVYDNQRVCITAPCPSYTLITPGAVRLDVARLEIEPDAAEATALVADAGALVHGTFESGSWKPGAPGPGLVIDRVLEPAKPYLVARHDGGAAAPYAVVNAEGMDHHVDRIDLDGFLPGDSDDDQTLASLVSGQWAARGFLARSDTGEGVLFVTGAAGASIPCLVAASDIECVTAPCPIWEMASMDGEPLGNAARVELAYLQLPEDDEATIEGKLLASGGAVFGWLAEGSWDPGHRGDVLLVVRLLE